MIQLSIFTVLILFSNFVWCYLDPKYDPKYLCLLPKSSGESCQGRGIYKYYWNDDAKKCSLFYYGGCDGNGNSFYTKEECMYYCGRYEKIRQNENEDNDDDVNLGIGNDDNDNQVNGKMTALEYLRKLIHREPSTSMAMDDDINELSRNE